MTNRVIDENGYLYIEDNPISKVGVFQYSGAQVGDPDQDRIFNVYRPAEELSNPETIKSFTGLPLIDEHEMLGSSKNGYTPPEEKGVEGFIGDNVYFDAPYLKGNIKVLSEKMQNKINNGKVELSCGYACSYEKTSGEFEGEPYDYIQRHMRGNHVALVDQGRMGSDVAVMDAMDAKLTITIDTKETTKMDKEALLQLLTGLLAKQADGSLTPDEQAQLDKALAALNVEASDEEEVASDDDTTEPEKKASDEDEDGEKASDEDDAEKAEDDDDKEGEDDDALAPMSPAEEEVFEALADAIVETVAGDSKLKGKAKGVGMDAKRLKVIAKKAYLSKRSSKRTTGMDAATIARNVRMDMAQSTTLAKRLSNHIGTFDHAAMDCSEVAAYGAKKLGLKGKSIAEVNAYLSGLEAGKSKSAVATSDSVYTATPAFLSNYLKGSK